MNDEVLEGIQTEQDFLSLMGEEVPQDEADFIRLMDAPREEPPKPTIWDTLRKSWKQLRADQTRSQAASMAGVGVGGDLRKSGFSGAVEYVRPEAMQETAEKSAKLQDEANMVDVHPGVRRIMEAGASAGHGVFNEAGMVVAQSLGLNPVRGGDVGAEIDKAVATVRAAATGGPEAIAHLVGGSLFQSVPAVLMGSAGALAGSPGVAIGTFLGSLSVEEQAAVGSYLMEARVDITDPEQLAKALSDAALMEKVNDRAFRRGVGVAAVEGLTSLVAGKMIGGIPGVKGKIAALGAESFGEGAGEVGGQVASGEGVDLAEATVEVIAGAGQSVGGVATQVLANRKSDDTGDTGAEQVRGDDPVSGGDAAGGAEAAEGSVVADAEPGDVTGASATVDANDNAGEVGEGLIRDPEGNPVVVYHGTGDEFVDFDLSESEDGGIYFTSRRDVAEGYTTRSTKSIRAANRKWNEAYDEYYDEGLGDLWSSDPEDTKWDDVLLIDRLNSLASEDGSSITPERASRLKDVVRRVADAKHELDAAERGAKFIPRVIEANVSMSNPKVVDASAIPHWDIVNERVLEGAKQKGHDGAIIKNIIDTATGEEIKSDLYVVFDPSQIRKVDESADVGERLGDEGTVGGQDDAAADAGDRAVGEAGRGAGSADVVADVGQDEGAVPDAQLEPESAKEPEKTIGLKKAEIDRTLTEAGREGLSEVERRRWSTALSEAKSDDAETIAKGVLNSPRAVSDTEHAAMVKRAAELSNEYEAKLKEGAELADAGKDGSRAFAEADGIMDRIEDLMRASDMAGTEAARSLSIRRMMLNRESFKIADVVQRAAKRKGEKLTGDERQQLQEVVSKLEERDKQVSELEAKLEKAEERAARTRAEQAIRKPRKGKARKRADILAELAKRGLADRKYDPMAPTEDEAPSAWVKRMAKEGNADAVVEAYRMVEGRADVTPVEASLRDYFRSKRASREDFVRYAGSGYVSEPRIGRRLSKDGASMDAIVQHVANDTGLDVSIQDVVDYLVDLQASEDATILDQLQERHKELTGRRIGDAPVHRATRDDDVPFMLAADGLVYSDPADWPKSATAQMKRDGVDPSRVMGMVGDDGKVYVNPAYAHRAEEIVRHELAHVGLRGVFGDQVNDVLDGVASSKNERLQEIAADVRQRYAGQIKGLSKREADRLVAEEVIAKVAETDFQPSRIKAVYLRVKKLLKDLFGLDYSIDEIRAILMRTRGYTERMSGPSRYMTAYHGTPHKFDRFSAQHIGTGEGAQAYGWGLYFASNKEIAEHYKDQLGFVEIKDLSIGSVPIYRNGVPIDYSPRSSADMDIVRASFQEHVLIQDYLFKSEADPVPIMRRLIDDFESVADPDDKATPELMKRLRRSLDSGRYRHNVQRHGAVLEVDLAPKDYEYLLFDKPLTKQSKHVKEALKFAGIWKEFRANASDFSTHGTTRVDSGEGVYAFLEMKMGSAEAASKKLLEIGIRGNKYLDGSSRNSGRGSYNYVIFDDADVEIKQRYALDNFESVRDLIRDLALSYVNEGTTLDEVVTQVQDAVPDATAQEIWDALSGRNKPSEKKVRTEVQKRVAALKREARLMSQLADAETGIFDPKRKKPATPKEIKDLRKKLNQLRQEFFRSETDAKRLNDYLLKLDKLRDDFENNVIREKQEKKVDPEAIASVKQQLRDLRSLMQATETANDLEAQLRGEKPLVIPPKREARIVSKELERARARRDIARAEVRKRIADMERSTLQKNAVQFMGMMRSLKLSGDRGGIGRQSLLQGVSMPKEFGEAILNAERGAWNEEQFYINKANIESIADEHNMLGDGIELTAVDGSLKGQEENFIGEWAENLPVLGPVVKNSNRHMVGLLNEVRVKAHLKFLEAFPDASKEMRQAHAQWVMVTTGRGNVGSAVKSWKEFAVLFLAPRFAVSRIQAFYLFGKEAGKATARVSKKLASGEQITKEDYFLAKRMGQQLGAYVGFVSTVMGLLVTACRAAGEDDCYIGADFRDSDFGKVVIGPLHVDLWGGHVQPVREVLQALFDEDETIESSVSDWLRHKYNVTVTLTSQLINARDWKNDEIETGWIGKYEGKLADRGEILWRSWMPIVLENAYDGILEDRGWKVLVGSSAGEIMGVGVGVYDKKMPFYRFKYEWTDKARSAVEGIDYDLDAANVRASYSTKTLPTEGWSQKDKNLLDREFFEELGRLLDKEKIPEDVDARDELVRGKAEDARATVRFQYNKRRERAETE